MKKLLLLILCFTALLNLFAQHSDDFLIGNYSYIKSYFYPNQVSKLDTLITRMEEANYNASIWESNTPQDQTEPILAMFNEHHIDSFISDHYAEVNDNNTGLTSASLRTITSANYWFFEAEYDNETNIDDTNSDDKYFYMFDVENRAGEEHYLRSEDYNWKCESTDSPGYVFRNLRKRWDRYKDGIDNTHLKTHNKKIIGREFTFPFSAGEDYLEFNKLYIRYTYKISEENNDHVLLGFTTQLAQPDDEENIDDDDDFTWHSFKMIPVLDVPENTNSDTLKYLYFANQLNSDQYSRVSSDEDLARKNFREIEFVINLKDVYNQIGMEEAGWNRRLYGISPEMFFYGGSTIEIEGVEIYDEMYRLIDEEPQTVQSILDNRLSDYSNGSVTPTKQYAFEEPSFPQLNNHSRIQEQNINVPDYTLATWLIDADRKKANSARYFHPNLAMRESEPDHLMVDIYPVKTYSDWNSPNHTYFIQDHLDWFMLSNYRRAKIAAGDKPFYTVPATSGKWNTSENVWKGYMYPTPNMAKCLKYLPLCYGVDGTIDFMFYKEVETENLIPDRENKANDDLEWHAYLNLDQNGNVHTSAQYYASIEANKKIKKYGPILKNLNWIDSKTLQSDGAHFADNCYIFSNGANLVNGLDRLPENNVIERYFPNNAITAYNDYQEHPQEIYDGFVQIGYYEDDNENQTFMLVNRKTDYLFSESNMSTITPEEMKAGYSHQGRYYSANNQYVKFDISQANSSLREKYGDCIALYDIYTNQYYVEENDAIKIEIEPGEALMLELVSTIPENLTEDLTIGGKVQFTQDIVTIPEGLNVNVLDNSSVFLSSNTSLVFEDNSSLCLRGCLNINNPITIPSTTNLTIQNSPSCLFSYNSKLSLEGGSLTIDNALLTGKESLWQGIQSFCESSDITLTNSIIENSMNIIIQRTPLTVSNCDFYVPDLGVGLTIMFAENNDLISFSGDIRFFGQSGNCSGLTIHQCDLSSLNLSNFSFTNLSSGFDISSCNIQDVAINNNTFIDVTNAMKISNSSYQSLESMQCNFNNLSRAIAFYNNDLSSANTTISECSFNNCSYGLIIENNGRTNLQISNSDFYDCERGIYSCSSGYYGRIENCDFSNPQTTQSNIGIELNGAIPSIMTCSFNYCDVGVLSEYATYIREGGIYNSEFNFCADAVIARKSNMRVESNTFYRNTNGLICYKDSNLDISNNANNVMQNKSVHIKFPYNNGQTYNSNIQILTGHNDFYHYVHPTGLTTFDFYFHSDFYNYAPINASKNWFEDNASHVFPSNTTNLVSINAVDSSPNITIIPEDDRISIALNAENSGNFDLALSIYTTILNEALMTEESIRNSCLDGVFRCDFLINKNVNETLAFLESKKEQYEIIDENFTKLIDTYILKVKTIDEQYDQVITYLKDKINNPVSEIDSLTAVMDLEIVMKLSGNKRSKSDNNYTISQYQFDDIEQYHLAHRNHWEHLENIVSCETNDNNQAPVPQVISMSNFPNPFNPETTIRFGLPQESNVKISIYNIKGQLIKNLCHENMEAGYHDIVWNGKNNDNKEVSSGIYFTRISTEKNTVNKKITLIK